MRKTLAVLSLSSCLPVTGCKSPAPATGSQQPMAKTELSPNVAPIGVQDNLLDLPVKSITVNVYFSGDGLNDDSSLRVRVEGPNGASIGEKYLQEEMNDHGTVAFPLVLSSHPKLADLDHSQLYLQIDTAHHGTDACQGRAVVLFAVEGGLVKRVVAGKNDDSFHIGTKGESNSTRLPLNFDRPHFTQDPYP